MEKKELEDIYNEFLDYANNKAEQHEFIAMLQIDMTLTKQLMQLRQTANTKFSFNALCLQTAIHRFLQ